MKTIVSLSIAFTALALGPIANAIPTLTGPTGLVAVPTAEVAPPGTWALAADYYATDHDTYGAADSVPIRLVHGVAQDWEIGGTFLASDDQPAWGAHVKYRIPTPIAGFDVATGAQYNSSDNDLAGQRINATAFFVATDRQLSAGSDTAPASTLTLGANYLTVEGSGWDAQGFRVNGGLQFDFPSKLSVAIEAQTGHEDLDAKPITSVVVRYPFTPTVTGQIGYTNTSDLFWWNTGSPLAGGEEHNLFAGVTVAFGGDDD